MKIVSEGRFDPLCINNLTVLRAHTIPAPVGLKCRPCINPRNLHNYRCCCGCYLISWPGFTVAPTSSSSSHEICSNNIPLGSGEWYLGTSLYHDFGEPNNPQCEDYVRKDPSGCQTCIWGTGDMDPDPEYFFLGKKATGFLRVYPRYYQSICGGLPVNDTDRPQEGSVFAIIRLTFALGSVSSFFYDFLCYEWTCGGGKFTWDGNFQGTICDYFVPPNEFEVRSIQCNEGPCGTARWSAETAVNPGGLSPWKWVLIDDDCENNCRPAYPLFDPDHNFQIIRVPCM